MRWKFSALLFLPASFVHAQGPQPAVLPQVVVNGTQTDVEASRDFVAGKIVIGKARIQESGVQNAGELLAREPAISIGKDGRLGLLGMSGYTQVLVDGSDYTGDAFAIDVMRIERIEITKSSTAVTGPIGIAGTINIVLRKTERKASTQVSVGATTSGGRISQNASMSSNQLVSNSALSYSWKLSALNTVKPNESQYTQSRSAPELAGAVEGVRRFRFVGASGELAWKINSDHKLSFSPELGHYASADDNIEQRRWQNGAAAAVAQANDSSSNSFSLPLLWNWQVDADSTLAIKLQVNHTRTGNHGLQLEQDDDRAVQEQRHRQQDVSTNRFVNVDYATALDGGHDISAGVKLIRNGASSRYADSINGQPDLSLAVFGDDSATRMDRVQLFAQDEWRINRRLALNAGLSVEQRHYNLDEGSFRSQARFTMWSPSIHLSQKFNGDSKRQFRVSLARSFSPPYIDQLMLHPTVNAFAPCVSGQLCGTNSIDTFDTAGNPSLQPERALGLNLSYTHGFGKSSEVLLEFYQRDFSNKIGYSLELADVPWASTPRYVLRPANLGQAITRGINVEARLDGKDLAPFFAQGELHGSVGVARSTLSDLPGPDNHLAEQLPWRVKLGGSYTLRAIPVKLGVEASLLPADWVRNNLTERVYQSSKATLGVNASWKLNTTSRITANLDNLLHRNDKRITAWQDSADYLQRTTDNTTYTRFALRFETSL